MRQLIILAGSDSDPQGAAECTEVENAMANVSDTDQLLRQIKMVMKAKGIRYVDIAGKLEVSEKTVKRYMTGKGLSLSVMETICRVAGITLLELAAMTASGTNEERFIDDKTEEALGEDLFTGMIFTLLNRGWTVTELEGALDVTEPRLNRSLAKLDRMGVIRLDPFNRVKVLAKTRHGFRSPRRSGTRRIKAIVFDGLSRISHDDPNLIWRIGLARLTEEKLPLLARMFDTMLDDVYAMETRTADGEGATARWYSLPMFAIQNEGHPVGDKLTTNFASSTSGA